MKWPRGARNRFDATRRENHGDISGKVLLQSGDAQRDRRAGGHGLLSLRVCRSWSAGPVNAFSLWAPEAVKVTKGAEHIGSYRKTEASHRKFCKLCGGHLMAAGGMNVRRT